MIDESRGPALLIAAYFLTLTAWIFTNPPGAPPDEAAHYIRAAAVSTGDLLPEDRPSEFPGVESTTSVRWMLKQARLVSMPGPLSPESFRCRGIPGRVEPCDEPASTEGMVEELTYVGTYPPTPYLVPGVFMRAGSNSDQAIYLGRAGSALVCWLLLALAAAVIWDKRTGWMSAIGLLTAISPMVIYMASSLSGSGLETSAAICFLASLLRLTRKPDSDDEDSGKARGPHPGWIWGTVAFSGALLAASRDLGVVWLGLHLCIFFGWVGVRSARATFRAGGRAALAGIAALAISVAVSIAWQVTVQVRPPFALTEFLGQMRPSFAFFFSAVRQQIGVFGPLDTVLPVIAYAGWLALTLLVFALAMYAGDGRRRVLAGGAVLGTAVFTVALDAVQRTVGFGVQGRYLLPLAVAIPMVGGEILSQNADKLKWLMRRGAGMPATALISGVLFLGWYTIGRRYSVGLRGSLLFFEGSAWSPPLGWAIWGSLAAAGVLSIMACGLLSARRLPRTTD